MAPLEIYCYHRPLLHLFAWIRLSTTTPGCWKFSRQKRSREERRRKQAHIFSGTFEVCLIFCKIGSLKLSNVKRLSIRRQEICAELSYFFFHFLQMTVFSFKRIEKKIVSLTSKSCSSNYSLIIVPNGVFRLAIFRLD